METEKKKYRKTLAEKLLEDRPRNQEVEEYKRLRKLRKNNPADDPLVQQGYEIVSEERQVVAPPGQLKSRTMYQTPSLGTIDVEKLVRCNTCGWRINENYFVCYACGLVVCPKCALYWQGAYVCRDCVEEKIPFTKRHFKVLLAVANKITNTRKISKLAKIPKETVWEIMEELFYAGLIERRGWILKDSDVTDYGQQFIDAFGKIYARDGDVQQFLLALDMQLWRA
jgi:ribosomal protein L37E/predicted transcriptional regulator